VLKRKVIVKPKSWCVKFATFYILTVTIH